MKILKKIFLIVVLLVSIITLNNAYVNIQSRFTDEKSEPVTTVDFNSSKIEDIIEHKEEYPEKLLEMLSRNKDMADYVMNYPENEGKVFTNDIGHVIKGEFPLLLQYDQRWGYGIYGDNVIAINGCGPTSMAMVIAGLTGRSDLTPYDIACDAYERNYYRDGTIWSFFTEGVKKYGLIGKELPLSKGRMIEELRQGHPIICSMGKGDFTTTGHIIVICGVKDDKFVVHDPNSKERSQMLWDFDRIQYQIKNLWSFEI